MIFLKILILPGVEIHIGAVIAHCFIKFPNGHGPSLVYQHIGSGPQQRLKDLRSYPDFFYKIIKQEVLNDIQKDV
jgi:hypothetical protein